MSELLKNIEPPMSREKLQQIEKTKAVKKTAKKKTTNPLSE